MAWTTKLGGRIPPYRNAVRFDGEPRRTRRSVMRHVPLEPLVTVIALFLVAVSPAGAQRPSDLVRRKLSAVTVIDGIACGVTGRAYAYFHPSGRLAECPLATDTVLFGQTLPARTWVELTIDGRLRHAWLPHDVSLSGHQCLGRGYKEWSVLFHPSGALALCFLPQETVIEGVPCQRGTFWNELRGGGKSAARFHENGRLESCQAARSFELNGRHFRQWQVVQLDPSGRLLSP